MASTTGGGGVTDRLAVEIRHDVAGLRERISEGVEDGLWCVHERVGHVCQTTMLCVSAPHSLQTNKRER